MIKDTKHTPLNPGWGYAVAAAKGWFDSEGITAQAPNAWGGKKGPSAQKAKAERGGFEVSLLVAVRAPT